MKDVEILYSCARLALSTNACCSSLMSVAAGFCRLPVVIGKDDEDNGGGLLQSSLILTATE
jgi:hypothetical protein